MRQADGTAAGLTGAADSADSADQADQADQAGLAGTAGLAGGPGGAGLRASAADVRRDRLRTLGLWCALALAAAALAGVGMLTWRSLQADKAIALVARSAQAGPTPAPAPLPEVASAQDVAVVLVAPAEPVVPAAAGMPGPPAAPAAPVAATEPAPSDTAVPQAGAKPPAAQARVALAKPGKQARAPVKRASVRAKGKLVGKASAVRRVKASSSASVSGRQPVTASVRQRLAQCREKAGEAAAACFARACRSYARHAPVCLNDEPARRRR